MMSFHNGRMDSGNMLPIGHLNVNMQSVDNIKANILSSVVLLSFRLKSVLTLFLCDLRRSEGPIRSIHHNKLISNIISIVITSCNNYFYLLCF